MIVPVVTAGHNRWMSAPEVGVPADGRRRGRPRQGRPVLDRSLSLLAAFTDRRRALGLTELALLTEMPVPSASRHVRQLVEWGALERRDDGKYVIGVRLWEVASLAPRGHGVREVALPFMEDLHDITRHHVLLAVRENVQAVLIERLTAHGATDVAYRVGGRLPLRSTAVGLVLLAGAELDLQQQMIEATVDHEPGATVMGGAELRIGLAQIRRTGVGIVRRTLPSRTISIASPIRGSGGSVRAALSVVVPDGEVDPATMVNAVAATALHISRALGLDRGAPRADR